MTTDSLREAASALRHARDVVVFTGAGVSAESGIPTFRDDSGLWQQFPPDHFATVGGLMKTAVSDPQRLAEFLLAVLEPITSARVNAAHRAIADLERHVNVTVITQNIDGLHQLAGSTVVHEVHGSMFEIVTLKGRFVRLLSRSEMQQIVDDLREVVERGASLVKVIGAVKPMLGLSGRGAHRPKVVLFGEEMAEPDWSQALARVEKCDCLMSIGTSGAVMPAASLPRDARDRGATVIDVNLQPGAADFQLAGCAAEIVPRLVESAFGDENM